jgi:corrinoid protein of di/trimethylamine methyltransferase
MEKAEYMEKAAQCIVDADEEAVEKLAQDYLDQGFDPLEMIEKGLSEGIQKLGDLFDRGEVFLPHLIIASEAMTKGVSILEQAMPKDQVGKKLAKVVIGTIEGDVHDIGKGIVATMLRVYGFEVIDLGRDVPIATFVEKVKEFGADVVGSSALMTTTMVGGAATTEHWADKIGANIWAESAGDTVIKLKEKFSE